MRFHGVDVLDNMQFDGPPQVIDPIYPFESPPPKETSQSQPGQYYVEERILMLPYPIVIARYAIQLAIYDWQTPDDRFAAPGVDDQNLLPIKTVIVDAW
jgi:hypothetical protein